MGSDKIPILGPKSGPPLDTLVVPPLVCERPPKALQPQGACGRGGKGGQLTQKEGEKRGREEKERELAATFYKNCSAWNQRSCCCVTHTIMIEASGSSVVSLYTVE